jgi:hypothetical protein
MSTLTPSINNPGNGQADNNSQRHTAPVSLQGISHAINQHQGSIGAYSTVNRKSSSISA